MKSAKEIFEELGYMEEPLRKFARNIVYRKGKIEDTNKVVRFNIITHKYSLQAGIIDIEIHNAIHKKLKELNWL
jgi:hypothetical protein